MENISFLIAFTAGILSFLSPCVLPLVPVYIANLAGASVVTSEFRTDYRTTLPHALSFIAGFSVIFIALGASVGFIGSLMLGHMVLLRQIAGGLLIFLGFHLTGMLRIPLLYR